jgi:hypothetical protein
MGKSVPYNSKQGSRIATHDKPFCFIIIIDIKQNHKRPNASIKQL